MFLRVPQTRSSFQIFMLGDMRGVTCIDYVGRGASVSGFKPTGKHREKVLTAAAVRNVGEGFHADGGNLYLKVDPSGARRWIVRVNLHGKRRDFGLGPAALVSLSEAREQALQIRKQVRVGEDPLAAKKRAAALLSFKEAAETVHKLRLPSWRNGKHGKQWISTLEVHAFPVIGNKRIDTISSADVMAVLTPIWNTHNETARRVKQRIGTVLEWAIAQGWRTDDPTATVQQVLPKHDRSKVKHRKALPYQDVGKALAKVRASGASAATKLAFDLMVHTACRPGEVRGAVWSEFDLDTGVWVIPENRMKAKREHRIPLPPHCLKIMENAAALRLKDNDLVFPSVTGKPLSDATLSKLTRELNIAAVPHGFRSSFRDWAGETTNHAREVIEHALAHGIKDKAEAAYARGNLMEKRKKLMADWATFLAATVSADAAKTVT